MGAYADVLACRQARCFCGATRPSAPDLPFFGYDLASHRARLVYRIPGV